MVEIRTCKTPEAVATEAALLAAEALRHELDTQQLASFVLAGGTVPPLAFGILSSKYADVFDWKRVLFLIGDERCVPLDDPQSSWLALESAFAARPEVPTEHKLRPPTQLTAETAAKAYANTLRTLPQNGVGLPRLSHLWFGIGEDGHTLSLFPNHPSSQATNKLVIPVHNSPKPPPDRISFSYKALAGVKTAVAFITGSSKAPILAQIAKGDHSLPIVVATKTIQAAGGQVTWLIDEAALTQIPKGLSLRL